MSTGCRRFEWILSRFPRLGAIAIASLFAFSVPAFAVDADGDGFEPPQDCNDGNPSIKPGATEICNGVDDNCNGQTDELVDPDPVNGINDDGDVDGEGNALIDEGFGFCVLSSSLGPDGTCFTAGRSVCQFPAGPVISDVAGFGTLTCVALPGNDPVIYADENSAAACSDLVDNDCDGALDLADSGCPKPPEICDGIDNDVDGSVDEGFPVGAVCSSEGTGACVNEGVYYCNADGSGVLCSAVEGNPEKEGVKFGDSCEDGVDNDCDGESDLADGDCAGFGIVELCNDVDDDSDGKTDEGFLLGAPCSEGLGDCTEFGVTQCKADGSGTECSVIAGSPSPENEGAGTCVDFKDNDCDGSIDAKDPSCASAYADLGVTCSLPYDRGKPGADCTGWHVIQFSGGSAEEVQADLLALDTNGGLLATIENVHPGDLAHLASRKLPQEFKVDSKTNKQGTRHTMWAPLPILRVTGKKPGVEDVAYCSILPYLDVTEPDGVTISLSDAKDVDVKAFVPLVNVNTLSIKLDGVDIVQQLGLNPVAAFPTGAGALCKNPGDCIVEIEAGCGEGTTVGVEVTNLRVEGLDTQMVLNAKDGVEVPNQVNTVSFNLNGLPAGGHVVYINGSALPLPKRLAAQCVVDDLADTGKASAFGIAVSSPTNLEVVASAPVNVQGRVCGGNEIASLQINGLPLSPAEIASGQICTPGNGVTTANECYLPFDVPVPEKDLQQAALGQGHTGTFKRGSNRVIADASDVLGNRAFNTDVIFGLGDVSPPLAPTAMAMEFAAQSAVKQAVFDVQMAMTTVVSPEFVVGLKEEAVQKFFEAKCPAAIADFTAKATESLQGANLGDVTIDPDCSCSVTAHVVLEQLTFDDTVTGCHVEFVPDQINVSITLPNIRMQAGAHDSCTDHGLFGECIARTKIDVSAATRIEDISFAFSITETGIETKTPPDPNTFTFAFAIKDDDGSPLYTSNGTCSGGDTPGRTCINNGMCKGGGTCTGLPPKNGEFDPVVPGSNHSGIECWGADLCTFFEAVGAVFITVFTFGIVDGFEVIGFLDFDVDVNEDFLDALKVDNPDPLELHEIEVDEGAVKDAGSAEFVPGPIDVEIEDGGLTAAFDAEFSVQSTDPMVPPTTGAVLTEASAPSVAEVIAVGSDVTMLVADDVFAQIFAAMKITGALKATCNPLDGLTIDELLPADADGGCESLGGANVAGATIRGICHAIRSTRPGGLPVSNCNALPDEGGGLLNNTKQGVCVGFQNGDCSALPFGPKVVCNATPYRDIQATDGVLACARQDMEPDLLIQDDNTADNSVGTQLFLEDLNVVFALDRNNDGAYNGTLESLPSCLAASSNGAGDCKVIASCLDLTITANMSVDPSECAADEAGFVFSDLMIVEPASDIDFGVMCGASTGTSDENALLASFESKVIDTINQAAENFTPPICVEGLTLGGVLDFTSSQAKVFGLTTDGVTPGFADYLGITVPLAPPQP